MPRHYLNLFWSLKLDFDNEFPAKTPKLYSTTTTVETAIDPTQFLVETPPFWPFSKYTDPSSTDPVPEPNCRRHDDQIQTSLNMSESNWSQAFQIVDSPASSSQTTTDTFDASVVIQDDLFSNSKIF